MNKGLLMKKNYLRILNARGNWLLGFLNDLLLGKLGLGFDF